MSMIEKVARAIWNLNENTDCPDYGQLSAAAKKRADDWARAAIAAMREPSPEMLKAAEVAEDKVCCAAAYERLGYEDVYPVMIEAALAHDGTRHDGTSE